MRRKLIMVCMMTYIKEGTYTPELLEMDEVPPKIKMIQRLLLCVILFQKKMTFVNVTPLIHVFLFALFLVQEYGYIDFEVIYIECSLCPCLFCPYFSSCAIMTLGCEQNKHLIKIKQSYKSEDVFRYFYILEILLCITPNHTKYV